MGLDLDSARACPSLPETKAIIVSIWVELPNQVLLYQPDELRKPF